MNPSLSHDLQFLNYLEVFGHRHGAAALRKAMHLPSELAPAGEAKESNPMAPDRPGYVPENWGWPQAPGTPGPFDWIDENAMVRPRALAAFNDAAQAFEGDNAGALERPEWPDIIGSGGQARSESYGTKLAAEIRAACNNLTEEEREEALAHGMRLIYSAPLPAKHRFIRLDGSPREEACCK